MDYVLQLFLTPEIIEKLEKQKNLWFSSVRVDGRPHLVPVWFVWYEGKIFIGTEPKSVKSNNIRGNPKVVVALEDGSKPVICEGIARPIRSTLVGRPSGGIPSKI